MLIANTERGIKVCNGNEDCQTLPNLGAFAKLRKATISLVMSLSLPVRLISVHVSAWKKQAPTGRIFIKYYIAVFFENLSRKLYFHQNRTGIKGILQEQTFTFLAISSPFILRMKNVSDKAVEKIKTHILCSITFFRKPRRYEVMWKNIVEPGWPETTRWRTRNACCINQATNTHSLYATPSAFPLQQFLHEPTSVLRYTYIACLNCETSLRIFQVLI